MEPVTLTYLPSISTVANDNGTAAKQTNDNFTENAIDTTIPSTNVEIDWKITLSGNPIT